MVPGRLSSKSSFDGTRSSPSSSPSRSASCSSSSETHDAPVVKRVIRMKGRRLSDLILLLIDKCSFSWLTIEPRLRASLCTARRMVDIAAYLRSYQYLEDLELAPKHQRPRHQAQPRRVRLAVIDRSEAADLSISSRPTTVDVEKDQIVARLIVCDVKKEYGPLGIVQVVNIVVDGVARAHHAV